MRRDLRGGILAVALLLGAGFAAFQPTAALARQSMSFSLGYQGRSSAAHAGHGGQRARSSRAYGRAGVARSHGGAHQVRAAASVRENVDEGPAAQAVPGKGFSMQNGVLTYPAPARFQPKNLRTR